MFCVSVIYIPIFIILHMHVNEIPSAYTTSSETGLSFESD